MAIYSIRDRCTRRELAVIEAPSFARALEWAARRGLSLADVDLDGIELRGAFLAGADLRRAGLGGSDLAGCYLRRADLRGADLREARLAHAFLGAADLRRADLREADLRRADLRGAHLVGADLRGTLMTGARLEGALCDWRWSTIPAELLRQRLGELSGGSRLIVALAFHEDAAPWGWMKLLAGPDPDQVVDRALRILSGWLREGDNAPALLRHLAADASIGRDGKARRLPAPVDPTATDRMAWTRGQRANPAGGPRS